MILIGNDLEVPQALGRPAATIGTFDGVHKGHQQVLGALRRWAAELGVKSLVVTFDRSPKTLTRGLRAPCITSIEHRLVLLERLGIDACAVLRFDSRLHRMSARDFAIKLLCGKLGVQGIMLGFNCRFGRGAEGDYEFLRRLAADGVCLARYLSRPAAAGGEPISSSAIREAIEHGRLRAAESMLGRPVSILGTVVRGLGRGTVLGFPTANLDLHHEVKPPSGVYITAALVDGKWLPALTSIGRQPTFSHQPRTDVVEVLIPGLRRDIYGRDVEVRFGRKLREQIAFGSPEALVAQIRSDVAALKVERP